MASMDVDVGLGSSTIEFTGHAFLKNAEEMQSYFSALQDIGNRTAAAFWGSRREKMDFEQKAKLFESLFHTSEQLNAVTSATEGMVPRLDPDSGVKDKLESKIKELNACKQKLLDDFKEKLSEELHQNIEIYKRVFQNMLDFLNLVCETQRFQDEDKLFCLRRAANESRAILKKLKDQHEDKSLTDKERGYLEKEGAGWLHELSARLQQRSNAVNDDEWSQQLGKYAQGLKDHHKTIWHEVDSLDAALLAVETLIADSEDGINTREDEFKVLLTSNEPVPNATPQAEPDTSKNRRKTMDPLGMMELLKKVQHNVKQRDFEGAQAVAKEFAEFAPETIQESEAELMKLDQRTAELVGALQNCIEVKNTGGAISLAKPLQLCQQVEKELMGFQPNRYDILLNTAALLNDAFGGLTISLKKDNGS